MWTVHKFGGTSVANADRYKGVAKILNSRKESQKAIVASAMSKVTDALIELVNLSSARNESYLQKLEDLQRRHLETVEQLIPAKEQKALNDTLEKDFADIKEVLRGVWQVRNFSERTLELVSGYGEIWSAQFLNAHLGSLGISSAWLDARQILVVEPPADSLAGNKNASVSVDWMTSQKNMDAWIQKNGKQKWVVITGFIATTPDGIPTTLRRNGSDFSASIFGALLKADEILIWTDVDGVLSADPRLVPDAVVLESLSYQEATELAYFGAKVVHPSTMAPAIRDSIPIWIKNTFNPEAPGTKIHNRGKSDNTVKGFATIDSMALINVEGTGMVGVPGVAQRLFGALKDVGVSVTMISQASSEQSICFAIPNAQAALAKATLEKTFFAELHHGHIQRIDVKSDCAIIAAVGDNMVERPGVSGKFFSSLGRAGVNIRAIAQGSSERNISAVIGQADERKALRAVHSAFYLSNQTISIGIVGPGLIGGTLLAQLSKELERLKKEFKIDLRVRGIMSSKNMLLDENQISLNSWVAAFENAKAADMSKFTEHICSSHLPHSVIIDCSASSELPKQYLNWLKKGAHLITPNKKANTMSFQFYQELKDLAQNLNKHYLYSTTVGAGLPIINTLRDLVKTGDRINEVEGIFSGTLSYLFNSFDGKKAFSEVVKDARQKGYTEPDPREDLSGTDVARKLIILAREMGREFNLEDVIVESLVPEFLRAGSVDDYLRDLPKHDAAIAKLYAEAAAQDKVLRYVATIPVTGKPEVKLKALPKTHAFARISATDNIVAFRTQRYQSQPLVIQGPGAGPEVTAGGIFADLLRLASYLGASL